MHRSSSWAGHSTTKEKGAKLRTCFGGKSGEGDQDVWEWSWVHC